MFAIHRTSRGPLGRKRRQVTEPSLEFNFPDPPRPYSIDSLNYTDEQRQFCHNITQCMFDLLFTGDAQLAENTMDVNMEATRQEIELSKRLLAGVLTTVHSQQLDGS